LKERLFQAYFRDGEAISDWATLVRLAEDVGLDPAKTSEVLGSGRYGDAVRADEAEAQTFGISGVPFFVIDRHFGISGAQSPEAILQVLEEAWTDSATGLVVSTESGTACEDGESCALPA
jgi:predicted DsbA family dithiol-disulfide isomerase